MTTQFRRYMIASEFIKARKWSGLVLADGPPKEVEEILISINSEDGSHLDATLKFVDLSPVGAKKKEPPTPKLILFCDQWAAFLSIGAEFLSDFAALDMTRLGREPTVADFEAMLKKHEFKKTTPEEG